MRFPLVRGGGLLYLLASLLLIAGCGDKPGAGNKPGGSEAGRTNDTSSRRQGTSGWEERSDLASFFTDRDLVGSILIYNSRTGSYISYDSARARRRFIPASTFKIFNSLVALETGVAPDENFTLKWDGKDRGIESWNQDQSMVTAFKYSAVWYYQELARRIGEKRMRHFIDTVGYGNRDISGGIDRFWLSGGLRISQLEQIEFLRRLYRSELPFSRRAMEIVRKLMLREELPGGRLSYKTGWQQKEGNNLGWLVGYLESGEDLYYFATNIERRSGEDSTFAPARIEITKAILRHLRFLVDDPAAPVSSLPAVGDSIRKTPRK